MVSSCQNASAARRRCSKVIRFHKRPAVGVMSVIADILCAAGPCGTKRHEAREETMITVENRQPVRARSAWRPADFETADAYSFTLTGTHVAAFDRALVANRDAGDFPLESIAGDVAAWRDEVLHGRGFVVLRELPRDRYSPDDLGMLFFGLGTHFGRAVSQSSMGDRLGHVVD